jgi:hypothetical protein
MASISLPAFKNLHQRRQLEQLACHGRALAERTEDSFRLSLYALGTFYAEIWRSLGDDEHVLFVHAFDSPKGLTDYLEHISLEGFE